MLPTMMTHKSGTFLHRNIQRHIVCVYTRVNVFEQFSLMESLCLSVAHWHALVLTLIIKIKWIIQVSLCYSIQWQHLCPPHFVSVMSIVCALKYDISIQKIVSSSENTNGERNYRINKREREEENLNKYAQPLCATKTLTKKNSKKGLNSAPYMIYMCRPHIFYEK